VKPADTWNFQFFLTELGFVTFGCCYSEFPQVLSVFVSRARSLHTTHSWRFLGLEEGNGKSESGAIPPQSLWRSAKFGKDVIVAHLDTGSNPLQWSWK
jgi:hypothetical protein